MVDNIFPGPSSANIDFENLNKELAELYSDYSENKNTIRAAIPITATAILMTNTVGFDTIEEAREFVRNNPEYVINQ